MPRALVINGESMVYIKCGAHVSGLTTPTQLGLTSERIVITPRLYHRDMKVDDFGPHVPAEVMANIAEVRISMMLVDFDYPVLQTCIGQSMGGTPVNGTLVPAGITLGRGKALYLSGNNLMGLSITSPVAGIPWTFPSSYIPSPPLNIPVGTEKSLVQLEWRAFPYRPSQYYSESYISGQSHVLEVQSSGAVLWTNTEMT